MVSRTRSRTILGIVCFVLLAGMGIPFARSSAADNTPTPTVTLTQTPTSTSTETPTLAPTENPDAAVEIALSSNFSADVTAGLAIGTGGSVNTVACSISVVGGNAVPPANAETLTEIPTFRERLPPSAQIHL